MHLYAITRGQKNYVDQMITELQGKYLPYNSKGKDAAGNVIEKQLMLQLAVRPIQLWEFAFPEECYDVVANTLWGQDKSMGFSLPGHNKKLAVLTAGMRKVIGLEKVPEWKTDQGWLPLNKLYTSILGVGIKKDKQESYGEGI